MKLLIASNAVFRPDGGNAALLAVFDLMRALAARDVEPALLCRDPQASGVQVRSHDALGFPVFRASEPAAAAPALAVAGEVDALVLLEGGDGALVGACGGLALPVLVWLTRPLTARPPAALPPTLRLLADGPAVAAAATGWFGRTPAILALPAPRLSVVSSREHALLLDPTPAGGIEIAFALAAARPQVRFVVAETEPLSAGWREACFARAARCGNIDWRSAGSLPAGLASARVLLAPAMAPDADPWPLRAAQAAGVPALATRHGALPDALGDAGSLVAPDASTETWLAAFDALWRDAARYAPACARQAAVTADAVAAHLLEQLAMLRRAPRVV